LDDAAAYYGPIRSERLARSALDALHALYPIQMCHPRCAGGTQARLMDDAPAGCRGPCSVIHADSYRRAIDEVRSLLESDQGAATAQLMGRLAEQAGDLPTLRDAAGREALEALIGCLGALGRARMASRACGVIVEPGVDGRGVTALFIWNGRVSAREELTTDGRSVVHAALMALGTRDEAIPLSHGELDAALILHAWLSTRAGHPAVVALRPDFDHVAAVADVLRAVRAMEIFSLPAERTARFASAA
jgi:excinuclease UvrABC nuclease subunit